MMCMQMFRYSPQRNSLWGLPFSTYAPRGGGGFKSPIHFHCVLHAKRGGGGPDSM